MLVNHKVFKYKIHAVVRLVGEGERGTFKLQFGCSSITSLNTSLVYIKLGFVWILWFIKIVICRHIKHLCKF